MNRQYNAVLISGEPYAIQQLVPLIQHMGLTVVVAGQDQTGHQTILCPPVVSDIHWVGIEAEVGLKKRLVELLQHALATSQYGHQAFSFTNVVYGSALESITDRQFDNRFTIIPGVNPRNEDG